MPKKPDDRVTINIRIPPDLAAELTATADDRCIGRNLIVTQAIRRLLADLAPLQPAAPIESETSPDGAWTTIYEQPIPQGAKFVVKRDSWHKVDGHDVRVIHEAELLNVSLDAGPSLYNVPPPAPVTTKTIPLVPPLEATVSGLYVRNWNDDNITVHLDLQSVDHDDNLPTVHARHMLRMEAIAEDLPGINVWIMPPDSCRQPDCDADATAGPWCPDHLKAILDHPDDAADRP